MATLPAKAGSSTSSLVAGQEDLGPFGGQESYTMCATPGALAT